MNSIDKLVNYVKKAAPFVGGGKPIPGKYNASGEVIGGNPTSSSTPALSGLPGPVEWSRPAGQMKIEAQFRLYLVDGFIPNTKPPVKPENIPLKVEEGTRGGAFIDKRALKKDLYEQSHAQSKTPAYGGIIVNDDGKILIRQAANMYGFEKATHSWTLSKGKPNAGESPADAALREVEEETGIQAEITSEVPGHFTSDHSSTKFFLMSVKEDTGKFDDETSEVKWVTPSEALEIFRKNVMKDEDGKELKDANGHNILHDSSQRDVDAVAMAMHHHKEIKGNTSHTKKEAMAFLRNAKKKRNYSALTDDLVSHYVETGDLPHDFHEKGGKYSLFIKALGSVTRHPTEMAFEYPKGVQMGYEILPKLYAALDVKYELPYATSFAQFHEDLTAAWKLSGAGSSKAVVGVLQEVIAELNGTPVTWTYDRKMITEDVNKDGKPIHRLDYQRDEIIEKWDAWAGTVELLDTNQTWHLDKLKNKLSTFIQNDGGYVAPHFITHHIVNQYIIDAKGANVPDYIIKDAVRDIIKDKYKFKKIGDITAKIKELKLTGVPVTKTPAYAKESKGSISQGAAKGEYSWGEEYDFNDGSVATINVHDEITGKLTLRDNIPSWELMASRAKAARSDREKHIPAAHNALISRLGKASLKAKHKNAPTPAPTPTAKEIDREGRAFIQEYAEHSKNMSKMALDAAWPNAEYLHIGRKTGSPREITGGAGIGGSKKITLDNLLDLGMGIKGTSVENPLSAHINSTALFGGSLNPMAYQGPLWISTKTHKRDVLQIHSLGRLYGGTERESIFMNDPDRESKVIWTEDGQKHKKWGPDPDGTPGLIPNGLHDYPEKDNDGNDVFTNGVYNAHLNYQDELEPATFDDNPIVQTGGNEAQKLGSNDGGLYKMKAGVDKGKVYYVKHHNPTQAANEGLSNTLYGIAGIKVPNTNVVRFGSGNALMSEWLPDPKGHHSSNQIPEAFKNKPELQSGFLVDAMLANYDVVGMNFDNIVVSNGDIYRLDQGGSLDLRAQGGKKDNFHTWSGTHIPELTSMLSPEVAPKASQVYEGMNDKTWGEAAKKLFTLTNSKIQDTVAQSAIQGRKMDEMTATLKKRRDSIINWLVKEKGPAIFPLVLEGGAKEYYAAGGGKLAVKNVSDHHEVLINALNAKYRILKMELLKATDPKLEKAKNKPSLWISGIREDVSDSDELTEDFEMSAQIRASQKANLENINTLMGEQE